MNLRKFIEKTRKKCTRFEREEKGSTFFERGYNENGEEIFFLEVKDGKEFHWKFPLCRRKK